MHYSDTSYNNTTDWNIIRLWWTPLSCVFLTFSFYSTSLCAANCCYCCHWVFRQNIRKCYSCCSKVLKVKVGNLMSSLPYMLDFGEDELPEVVWHSIQRSFMQTTGSTRKFETYIYRSATTMVILILFCLVNLKNIYIKTNNSEYKTYNVDNSLHMQGMQYKLFSTMGRDKWKEVSIKGRSNWTNSAVGTKSSNWKVYRVGE